jgi:hypothetical protein
MSEPFQIVIGFLALVGVFALTQFVVAWRNRRAERRIVQDLEDNEAFDPITAVDLPYAKQNPVRIGMRNYHAKAVSSMMNAGLVKKTGNGKYYLGRRLSDAKLPRPADDA